jgi:uncharacterized membrane protein YeaQ/YmgE (transglycosylase-associated protein family)
MAHNLPSGRRGYEGFAGVVTSRMLALIGLILFGLVIGIVAKLLMPGRDPGGMLITIVLGIAGSVLGGYLGRAVGLYGSGQGTGFFMALLGALILLGLYRLTRRTA